MPRTYRFVVGPSDEGLRLDSFLVEHLPKSLSRSTIQRVIENKKVLVGERAVKPHYHLKKSDIVDATLEQIGAQSKGLTVAPEPIQLDVVYEDNEVLVVNKPVGLVTHPAPGHWSGTLVNAILWHFQQGHNSLQVRGVLPRAGLVHRLDKDTSGLLIIAKSESSLFILARQLKDRLISRKYLALVQGHVSFDEGKVDAAIGRHLKDRKLMSIRHLGGRKSITHYRVIKRLNLKVKIPSLHEGESDLQYTLIELSLETGRTHQVRVHMAYLGHPVLGDSVYSKRPASYWSSLGVPRQLLHAYSIKFMHPVSKKQMEFSIGVPEDMSRLIPGGLLQPLDIDRLKKHDAKN